ncbi:diguanylate cyclase (GGDEF)-like protein [Deinococcus budaensis]|uniref:Diguanylate cyclase (GGDEF)-like protein n=2 Tax=Deinococcus budaensis TaxID=1665626 RepID=A0A7W8LPN5_9DEIO|nr:diguanylate cyclase (GGDEF)-like protein [Deinococcus budaensis]
MARLMRRAAARLRRLDPQRFLLWVPLVAALIAVVILAALGQLWSPYLTVIVGLIAFDLLALFGSPRRRAALLAAAPQAYALCLLSAWTIALYVLPEDPVTPMALLAVVLHTTTVYVFFFVQRRPRAAGLWSAATLAAFLLSALPHSVRTLGGNGAFDGATFPLTLLLTHGVLILVLASFSRARAQLASERAEARAMRELAHRDSLTGLHNRRKLEQDLTAAAARARPGTLLAVIDVDGLKGVNDTLGHAAGDDLLRRFAAGFAREVQGTARAYRLSGDEFALLFRRATPETAQEVVAAVTQEVRRSYAQAGASVGAAPWQRGETPSAWLSRADRAMYRHKKRTQEDAASGEQA